MDPRSALFDFSVALLVDKDRVEGRQLKESDIRQEIDYVKLQLNGLVRSYLYYQASPITAKECSIFSN